MHGIDFPKSPAVKGLGEGKVNEAEDFHLGSFLAWAESMAAG
jgi:hypothetical protein